MLPDELIVDGAPAAIRELFEAAIFVPFSITFVEQQCLKSKLPTNRADNLTQVNRERECRRTPLDTQKEKITTTRAELHRRTTTRRLHTFLYPKATVATEHQP